MLNVFEKWVGIAAIFAAMGATQTASAFFWGDDDDRRTVVSEVRAGPADYHKVYAGIKNTSITIEDFFLRTNDGKVYKIPTNIMTIDLQDLTAKGRGLVLDLRRIKNFPRNIGTIDVVEIETMVVNNINSRRANIFWGASGTPFDNGQCFMGMPTRLNFYTAPMVGNGIQMLQDVYLVKVAFSPLSAVQIDIVNRTQQNVDCDCYDNCRNYGKPRVLKPIMKCDFVNRRIPILTAIRPVDEA